MDIAEHNCGFRFSLKDDREYNFATKCPSYLRKYAPYETTEIDIESANPQFMDMIIGSSNAFNVYESLMALRGLNRSDAKVLFNKTVNSDKLKPHQAIAVYMDAGYTSEEAEQIAAMTCGNKIFSEMNKHEHKAIESYKAEAKLKRVVRLHDAIIMYSHNIRDTLPNEVNGIRFKLKEY